MKCIVVMNNRTKNSMTAGYKDGRPHVIGYIIIKIFFFQFGHVNIFHSCDGSGVWSRGGGGGGVIY